MIRDAKMMLMRVTWDLTHVANWANVTGDIAETETWGLTETWGPAMVRTSTTVRADDVGCCRFGTQFPARVCRAPRATAVKLPGDEADKHHQYDETVHSCVPERSIRGS